MNRYAALAACAGVLLAAAPSCSTLPSLQTRTCGNGVVEANEDCDGFGAGAGTQCGQPGGAGACRFVCGAASGGAKCPASFGCGSDGICRQSAGTYVRGEPIPAGAWQTLTGDFDGNGLADVVTRSTPDGAGDAKLRVHYFGTDNALSKTLVLAPLFSPPVIGDVNGDGRADLTFSPASFGGVDVMLGEADQTLAPQSYPSFSLTAVPTRITAVAGLARGEDPTAVYFADGQAGVLKHLDPQTGQFVSTLATLPAGPDHLLGDLVAAPAMMPQVSACPVFVFAYDTGDAAAWALIPCKQSSTAAAEWNDGAVPFKVNLPPNVALDRGVAAADINGDGFTDLLIGGVAGGTKGTYVAYSDGASAFHAQPGSVSPADLNTASPLVLSVSLDYGVSFAPTSPELPIAIGSISSDGHPDFVTPTGVLVSDGTRYLRLASKNRGRWTEAAIADFDADGVGDAIAGSGEELDLDFYLGAAGAGRLNPFSIPTQGTVTDFSVGDFDGDRVADLAFAQHGATTDSEDQLAIAWGVPFAPPLSPFIVGAFQKIVQVIPAPATDTAVTNAVILSKPADPTVPPINSISVVEGSGDRQPLAPLQLVSRMPELSGFPVAVATGAFAGDGFVDVVALAADIPAPNMPAGAFRLWTMQASGPAELAGATAGMPLGADYHFVYGDTDAHLTMLMTSGDVTGDNKPEVILAVATGATEDQSVLVVGTSQPTGKTFQIATSDTPIARPVSPEGQLQVLDVDGDGANDVVLLTGKNASPARDVVVFWNDGHGGFDDARTTLVDNKGDLARAFAWIDAGKHAPTFVYVTSDGVVLALLDPKTRAVTSRTSVGMAGDGTGISAGDVDGDGVLDLALADSGNLVILHGNPVLP